MTPIEATNLQVVYGSIVWSDRLHIVQSPLVVFNEDKYWKNQIWKSFVYSRDGNQKVLTHAGLESKMLQFRRTLQAPSSWTTLADAQCMQGRVCGRILTCAGIPKGNCTAYIFCTVKRESRRLLRAKDHSFERASQILHGVLVKVYGCALSCSKLACNVRSPEICGWRDSYQISYYTNAISMFGLVFK